MPRARSPNRDKAYRMWAADKDIKIKDIAQKLGVSESQIRKWKSLDQWEQKSKGTLPNVNGNIGITVAGKIYSKIEVDEEKLKEQMLTDKQKLFCLYYIKNRNATQSAINAGYSPKTAAQIGYQLLHNPLVRDQIKKYKKLTAEELLVDAMDVLEKYIKIAFADMTDFANWGSREFVVFDDKGRPLLKEDGTPYTEPHQHLSFKPSNKVDGSLIAQITKGRSGISIKLVDQLKALEVLKDYFDLRPDTFKRKMMDRMMELKEKEAENNF